MQPNISSRSMQAPGSEPVIAVIKSNLESDNGSKLSSDEWYKLLGILVMHACTPEDAQRLVAIVNKHTPVKKIKNLLDQKRKIDEIQHVADVDLVRSIYQKEARTYSRMLLAILSLVALSTMFFIFESSEQKKLNNLIGGDENTLPQAVNNLMALGFTDYCDAMSESYDIGSCNSIAHQKQQIFMYHWLGATTLTLACFELAGFAYRIAVFSSAFQSRILLSHLFPVCAKKEKNVPSAGYAALATVDEENPNNQTLTQPLQSSAATPLSYYQIRQLCAELSSTTCKATFRPIIVGLFVSGLIIIITLRHLMTAHSMRGVFEPVCYEPYTNTTSFDAAWSNCMSSGHFRHYDIEPPQAIYDFCYDMCHRYHLGKMPGDAYFAMLHCIVWLAFALLMSIYSVLRDESEQRDACYARGLLNKFRDYAASIPQAELSPGYDATKTNSMSFTTNS